MAEGWIGQCCTGEDQSPVSQVELGPCTWTPPEQTDRQADMTENFNFEQLRNNGAYLLNTNSLANAEKHKFYSGTKEPLGKSSVK